MWYLFDVTWGHSITCLAFQKSNNVILSSNVVFFNGPTTQVGIISLLVDVPLDVVRTHLRSCVGLVVGLGY